MRAAPVLAALGVAAVLVALSRRASAASIAAPYVPPSWTPGSSPSVPVATMDDEIARLDAESARLQAAEAAALEGEKAAIRAGNRAAEDAAATVYRALQGRRADVERRRTSLRLSR